MVGRGGANQLLCALLCGLGKTTASTSSLSRVQAVSGPEEKRWHAA